MMKSILASLLSLPFLAFAPPSLAQTAGSITRIDHIVAVVDADVILKSEMDRAEANVKAQYSGREGQLPPEDVLQKQILERLIVDRLQLARANDSGIKTSDAEVDQSISRVAEQNHITLQQMMQKVSADGMTYDEFRKSVREELTVNKLEQKIVESQVAVSDAEIDNELASQRAGGPQIHLQHILIAVPAGANADQIKTAQTKIDGIRDLIAQGKMDFSAAAIRYSDSQNALEGGDLGWRSLDEVPPAFANVVKTMKPGEMSAPVRGNSGFQLIRLVDVRQAGQVAPQQVTEYHALDMMVKFGGSVTSDQAKAKIDAIRAQLAAGADFGDLARKESEDAATNAKGGDMGWFEAGGWGSAVADQVRVLKDGEVSQPFQSDIGWHLIKLVGTRSTDVSQQAARESARQAILRRKSQDEYDSFLRQLRSEAYVDIRLSNKT